MNCVATGVLTPKKGTYERLTTEDVLYGFYFKDDQGNNIINPTDFTVSFRVENRTKEVFCSRIGGGSPNNCKIMSDGLVVFFLSKNSFSDGLLMCKVVWDVPYAGFTPNDKITSIGMFYTGIRYVNES